MAHSKYGKGLTNHQRGGEFELLYEGKVPETEVLARSRIPFERLLDGNTNRFYYGDNFDGLLDLLHDGYRNQVKLIYIDPPYATKGVFESRDLEHAYDDVHFGAHFIESLRQRLIVMRELLSDDGSIYVHLDGRMIFQIKVIMDEVFGQENFRNMITRKKCNSKNYTRKQYGNISDYILFYSKTAVYTWSQQFDPLDEEKEKREYRHIEPETGRRYMLVPIHAPGVRNGATGGEWRGMLPPAGKHWQYVPAKLDAYQERGEIVWSAKGNPRRKVYLDTRPGSPAQDIWLNYRDAHNQNIDITGYPTEKNFDLLCRIIEASSNSGDLVLDAFAGSGTTGFAAERLGRRWIMMDNSSLAARVINKRFIHGGKKIGSFKKATSTTPLISVNPPFSIYSPLGVNRAKLADEIGVIF
ncbi:site-specific DNA-methyltransferase [Deinococcus sp. YIM 134068]|uniref:site-specific DNA-methyltransferase n=1 Tax=Deinococcus lichenicola TaxID=3118910 RepID=UPI002F94C667